MIGPLPAEINEPANIAEPVEIAEPDAVTEPDYPTPNDESKQPLSDAAEFRKALFSAPYPLELDF